MCENSFHSFRLKISRRINSFGPANQKLALGQSDIFNSEMFATGHVAPPGATYFLCFESRESQRSNRAVAMSHAADRPRRPRQNRRSHAAKEHVFLSEAGDGN